VPAGSSLPDCDASAVELKIRSTKESYKPGEKPKFELIATNSGAKSCKLDFGPTAAVLTIEDTGDDRVWSSRDCPWTTEPILLQVPAGGEMSRTYEWNLRPSEPQCGTPDAGKVSAGSYQAEVTAEGLPAADAKFVVESA
jgi:hypothetical protein